MNYDFETDVAIIGAGPAGSSTSLFLSKHGIRHLLVDQERFPRDKVCGDGLSGKVVAQLKKINPAFIDELARQKENFLDSWGVRFVAPNGKTVDIPFSTGLAGGNSHPPGFVSRRVHFDAFLLSKIDKKLCDLRLQTKFIDYRPVSDGMLLTLKNGDQNWRVKTRLIVGAGGDRSVLKRSLDEHKLHPEHYYAGLRVYYRNVTGMHPQNFIELHFMDEALPGYFWIFPLPGNMANVGIGILKKDLKQRSAGLKKILNSIIEKNPQISQRFVKAEQVDEIRGWGLPLASQKRRLSGQRFLLVGDAGSLIDPFTGEGIGNAMLSGQIAADTIAEALKQNNFSAEFLASYDRRLYAELWDELKLSLTIQKLVRKRWLFNFVFNRLYDNPALQQTFSAMFNDLDIRAKLRSPEFYLKILLKK